jgi:propanediol dehydratase large subunit
MAASIRSAPASSSASTVTEPVENRVDIPSKTINYAALRRLVGEDGTIHPMGEKYHIRAVDEAAARSIATVLTMLGLQVIHHERKADE